jgi:hypothetical protein
MQEPSATRIICHLLDEHLGGRAGSKETISICSPSDFFVDDWNGKLVEDA